MSGAWRSRVARPVWGREDASSNLAAPTGQTQTAQAESHGARSSTGQSTGLLSRWLQVRLLPGARTSMVVVAQLVEPWIVVPVVVGSSPISHPAYSPAASAVPATSVIAA